MIVYLVGKYRSIPYPFLSDMEKKISILLGWIKVPVPALDTINAYYTDIKVNKDVKNLHQGLV